MKEEALSAIFSVRLSDGTFDSSLSVTVTSKPESYEPVIAAWLKLMHEALAAAKEE